MIKTKMTFNERNEYIDDAIKQFKALHDKYTSGLDILTDEQWKTYIDEMYAIEKLYLNSNLEGIMGRLCQAFLDDTELVQKKLIKIKGKLIT